MIRSRRTLFTLLLPPLATGCALSSDYPSLSPRPIEDVSFAEPVPQAMPPATSPAIAAGRFAPFIARARDGDERFQARLVEVRPALEAGRAAAVGSTPWAAAQQAFSRLQTARTPVAKVLADLQGESESVAVRDDPGLAAAAARALDIVAGIDQAEARSLALHAPAA